MSLQLVKIRTGHGTSGQASIREVPPNTGHLATMIISKNANLVAMVVGHEWSH